MAISIVALVVSIIVLVNYCPTQGLSFDYMGVIVGILSLLVTALIGAQVGQYVFVDKKIEKIASTITRTIARKAAQDEARRVAQSVAETMSKEISKTTAIAVVGGLPDDVKDMMRGKDLIRDAREQGMMSEMMKGIDLIMQALIEFKKCKYEVLYKSAIDDVLYQIRSFERMSTKCVVCCIRPALLDTAYDTFGRHPLERTYLIQEVIIVLWCPFNRTVDIEPVFLGIIYLQPIGNIP